MATKTIGMKLNPKAGPMPVNVTTPSNALALSSLDDSMNKAVTLAQIGHAKEGQTWATNAVAKGANAAQIAQLQSLGYTVQTKRVIYLKLPAAASPAIPPVPDGMDTTAQAAFLTTSGLQGGNPDQNAGVAGVLATNPVAAVGATAAIDAIATAQLPWWKRLLVDLGILSPPSND